LPKKYFLASGQRTSTESPLSAFDDVLGEAGIAECNLIYASSIDLKGVTRRMCVPRDDYGCVLVYVPFGLALERRSVGQRKLGE